jgi:hypothetical protein
MTSCLTFRRLDRSFLGLANLNRQFFAHDGHFRRGVDAEADGSAGEFHHRDGDFVANEDAFADFSRYYQHRKISLSPGDPAPRGAPGRLAYLRNGSGPLARMQAFCRDNLGFRRG